LVAGGVRGGMTIFLSYSMSIINKKTKVKKTKGHERTQTAATETAISYEEAERIGLSDLRFSAEEVPLVRNASP
jgi:hypothetical protein